MDQRITKYKLPELSAVRLFIFQSMTDSIVTKKQFFLTTTAEGIQYYGIDSKLQVTIIWKEIGHLEVNIHIMNYNIHLQCEKRSVWRERSEMFSTVKRELLH